jgi:NAD(P)-dependent dehydrogenase (short-subunit alcohol dehydrogenase family)
VSRKPGDKLAGRLALVTGGTRGIGAAICASQGATVAARYSANLERAEAFANSIEERFAGTGSSFAGTAAAGGLGRPRSPEISGERAPSTAASPRGRLHCIVGDAGLGHR